VTTVLLLSPLAFIGVRLGIWLNQRFNNTWFTRLIYTFLFLTGIQLLTGQNLLALLFTAH